MSHLLCAIAMLMLTPRLEQRNGSLVLTHTQSTAAAAAAALPHLHLSAFVVCPLMVEHVLNVVGIHRLVYVVIYTTDLDNRERFSPVLLIMIIARTTTERTLRR